MSDKNFYVNGTTQVVAIGAASAQSTAFGALTTHIRLATPAVGVWYLVGVNPTVTITNGAYLPPNWTETIQVSPGQIIACIQPTAPAGTFNITELVG